MALALCFPPVGRGSDWSGKVVAPHGGNKQKIVRAALDVDDHSVSVRGAGRIGPTKRPAHRRL